MRRRCEVHIVLERIELVRSYRIIMYASVISLHCLCVPLLRTLRWVVLCWTHSSSIYAWCYVLQSLKPTNQFTVNDVNKFLQPLLLLTQSVFLTDRHKCFKKTFITIFATENILLWTTNVSHCDYQLRSFIRVTSPQVAFLDPSFLKLPTFPSLFSSSYMFIVLHPSPLYLNILVTYLSSVCLFFSCSYYLLPSLSAWSSYLYFSFLFFRSFSVEYSILHHVLRERQWDQPLRTERQRRQNEKTNLRRLCNWTTHWLHCTYSTWVVATAGFQFWHSCCATSSLWTKKQSEKEIKSKQARILVG